ncbi:hypothetical protein M422DRAFT_251314 [Sphaerobolus stellatus SS14]|uniref:Defect at low temperature protein 1 n=1 Tax=Sphaerobolus stellatus (strain SS14) TaxID=990650 RepID=A0A0C9W0Y1_SPHS4|nr:hypothetical protein M422DRAFT_251314 [Sphaerobolus stellatus SS14]
MLSANSTRRFIEENVLFSTLLLASTVLVFIGGYSLFSQAQLSNSGMHLQKNWKAWFIIGCYAVLLVVSLLIIGRRARILALKLKRIPQKEGNVPSKIYNFIQEEYWRTTAIAYISQPKGTSQKGWGTPGGPYDGIRFRRLILDTVPIIDAQARLIAPRLPVLRPHVRIAQHLRALTALFPVEESSCLYTYDSVVQKARYSEEEPTEEEFESGMKAYQQIIDITINENLEEGKDLQLYLSSTYSFPHLTVITPSAYRDFVKPNLGGLTASSPDGSYN